jgi:shikimate dehydrogenase
MLNACKVVVNCTPVGTFPKVNECIGIPFDFLTDDHLVIDLIYNPPKSLFLNKAEISGATILNGETMLREQALRAWDIWNESPSK